jgi:hypothetical protein
MTHSWHNVYHVLYLKLGVHKHIYLLYSKLHFHSEPVNYNKTWSLVHILRRFNIEIKSRTSSLYYDISTDHISTGPNLRRSRGRDRIIVEFTTTHAISAYHQ